MEKLAFLALCCGVHKNVLLAMCSIKASLTVIDDLMYNITLSLSY